MHKFIRAGLTAAAMTSVVLLGGNALAQTTPPASAPQPPAAAPQAPAAKDAADKADDRAKRAAERKAKRAEERKAKREEAKKERTEKRSKASEERISGKERRKQCGAEWREARKAGKAEKGMTWPKFWSECNTRLKAKAT